MRTLAQSGLLPTVHPALRRGRDRDQPGRPRRDRRRGRRRLPDDHRLRGRAGRGRRQAGRGHRGAHRPRRRVPLGEEPGRAWAHGRFDAPYLRDSMLDVGVLVETLETATFWSNVDRLYADVKAALEPRARRRRRSCSATSRTSTRPAARSTSPSPRRRPTTRSPQWQAREGRRQRRDDRRRRDDHPPPRGRHRPQAVAGAEIGPLGVSVLRAVKADLDPTGILNPGVLIP